MIEQNSTVELRSCTIIFIVYSKVLLGKIFLQLGYDKTHPDTVHQDGLYRKGIAWNKYSDTKHCDCNNTNGNTMVTLCSNNINTINILDYQQIDNDKSYETLIHR